MGGSKMMTLAAFIIVAGVLLTGGFDCANADSVRLVEGGSSSDAFLEGVVISDGKDTFSANSAGEVAGLSALQGACLKEGQTCNPLNDKCCEGYYCFGGLIPTCVRRP